MEGHEGGGQDLLNLQDFNEEDLKKESEELLEMRFLNRDNAVFARTAGGFVSLKTKEKEYDRVGVYLTFPLTNPEEFISIREADEKAKEIGLVEKLSDFRRLPFYHPDERGGGDKSQRCQADGDGHRRKPL